MKYIKIIIGLAFIFACSLPAFSEKMNPSPKTVHKEIKSAIKVVLFPKQDSYPKMKPIKFNLKISDKNKPVEKASISMDLTMLEMEMPKNVIKFKETSKGIYEAEGMFTMSGSWRLVTSITNGKIKKIVNIDVEVE